MPNHHTSSYLFIPRIPSSHLLVLSFLHTSFTPHHVPSRLMKFQGFVCLLVDALGVSSFTLPGYGRLFHGSPNTLLTELWVSSYSKGVRSSSTQIYQVPTSSHMRFPSDIPKVPRKDSQISEVLIKFPSQVTVQDKRETSVELVRGKLRRRQYANYSRAKPLNVKWCLTSE